MEIKTAFRIDVTQSLLNIGDGAGIIQYGIKVDISPLPSLNEARRIGNIIANALNAQDFMSGKLMVQ